MPRFLLHVLLGALLLRAVALGAHALWLDEGATWAWATKATLGGTVFAEANHPPLWWVITRWWIALFGDSEASLRMPAALLGVVAVYLGWRLSKRLLDPAWQPRRGGFSRTTEPNLDADRVSLWFAALLALSAFLTEYAQEARMYSLLIVEALGLSLLYLRWLDDGRSRWMVGYAALAAAALYTHYFGPWIVITHGAHALWLWWRTRKDEAAFVRPWPLIAAGTAAAVLFVPWVLFLLHNYESISTGEPFEPMSRLFYVLWRVGAGGGLVVVDRARQVQGIPATIQDEAVWIAITSLLWFAPLLFGVWALRKRRGTASFVAFSVLVPITCCLLVFPVFQLIHERYLAFVAPYLILIAVHGARTATAPALRAGLTGALCALFGLGAIAYHGASVTLVRQDEGLRYAIDPEDPLTLLHNGHAFGKEPWRQAHAFVQEHAKDDSALVLLHPWYLRTVWRYYDRDKLDKIELPRHLLTADELDRDHGTQLEGVRRVFLVLAHEETEDPDDYVRVVADVLTRRWGVAARRTDPIWFDRSWGVRVAVFTWGGATDGG